MQLGFSRAQSTASVRTFRSVIELRPASRDTRHSPSARGVGEPHGQEPGAGVQERENPESQASSLSSKRDPRGGASWVRSLSSKLSPACRGHNHSGQRPVPRSDRPGRPSPALWRLHWAAAAPCAAPSPCGSGNAVRGIHLYHALSRASSPLSKNQVVTTMSRLLRLHGRVTPGCFLFFYSHFFFISFFPHHEVFKWEMDRPIGPSVPLRGKAHSGILANAILHRTSDPIKN